MPKGRYTRGGKNNQYAAEKRRQQVAALYVSGKTQREIAEILGSGPNTIWRDLTLIHEEWKASALVDFDTAKAEELAKINYLERRAWESWERSVQEYEIRHQKREFIRENIKGAAGKGGSPSHKLIPIKYINEKTTKGQCGDPRFLDQVAWCIETRLKILGLLKDTKNINLINIDFEQFHKRYLAGGEHIPDPIEERIQEALEGKKEEGSVNGGAGEDVVGEVIDGSATVVSESHQDSSSGERGVAGTPASISEGSPC